jgi:S1-C subfamily serine protease
MCPWQAFEKISDYLVVRAHRPTSLKNMSNPFPLHVGYPPHWYENSPEWVFPIGIVQSGIFYAKGTCFRLDTPGLFATASHVIGMGGEQLVVVLNDVDKIDMYQRGHRREFKPCSAELVAFDPIHDLAVVRVAEFEPFGAVPIVVAGTDSISVGTDTVSFGYPHLGSLRTVLTRFDGKIGAKILLPSPTIEVKYVVLNALARPGQSGGPVFRAGTNQLVAILSGAYEPPNEGLTITLAGASLAALSQTTHCVSAEYLRGMY